MKKVIIPKKIQVTFKSFAPPFFNYFSLSINWKKLEAMRAIRKKLNIFSNGDIEGLRASRQTYFEFRVWVVFVDDLANGGWFLFYWGLMRLWAASVAFENTRTVPGKWNISRVISRPHGWLDKTWRLSPLH